MDFFDILLPLGRTNGGHPESPCTEAQALALMDRYGVCEALAYNTCSRDCAPEEGNRAILGTESPRLHRIWALDPALPGPHEPKTFVRKALRTGVKAVLVNPMMRNIRIDRNPRIAAVAELLAPRRIPLLAVYRTWEGAGQDSIDWYALADFCARFPELPVIAWEPRARSNRPMFDALEMAPNLKIALSCVWIAQMIECVCEHFGGDRLLFSLGLPRLDPRMFQAVVTYADVPDAVKAGIGGGTARRLLEEADYGID